MRPYKTKILRACAALLFVLVTLNMIMHILYYDNEFEEIIWYCNSSAIVLGLSILLKRKAIITAMFITGVPSQFLWIVDTFLYILSKFINGIEHLGRTWILFREADSLLVTSISITLHAVYIPIAYYATYAYGFARKAYLYASFWSVFMYLSAYLFTNPEENINCVFYPCDLLDYEKVRLNPFYSSPLYLVKEMAVWVVYTNISYILFRFYFKKIGKLT